MPDQINQLKRTLYLISQFFFSERMPNAFINYRNVDVFPLILAYACGFMK